MARKKRRSPGSVIRKDEKPWLEQMYLKFPGRELVDVAKKRKNSSVDISEIKEEAIVRIYGQSSYITVHTHPHKSFFRNALNYLAGYFMGVGDSKMDFYEREELVERMTTERRNESLPSVQDLRAFLRNSKERGMVIVGQNEKSGKITGSFQMRKIRYLPRPPSDPEISHILEDYEKFSSQKKRGALEELANEYGLQYRQLDAKGKTLHKYRPSKGAGRNTVVAMIGLAAAIFLLSPALTGNAVLGLTAKTSGIFGVGLFVIGAIGAYLYFRK